MVQAELAAAKMNDDMGACTPKSGWLYSLEFIALLRLQECIAERAREMERRRAVVDGRFASRISYTDGTRYARVVGRGNERPQPRSREAHPMRLARHCLPHTRIREIRVSKASEPSNIRNERTGTRP